MFKFICKVCEKDVLQIDATILVTPMILKKYNFMFFNVSLDNKYAIY